MLDGFSGSPCESENITCVCDNIDSITVTILPCITSSCSVMDQLYTKRYTESMCDAPTRNISGRLIAIQWALFSLASVFLGLRLISRMPRFGGCLGWDDWIMLVVLVLSLSVNIVNHLLSSAGSGQDIWMLEKHQISLCAKVNLLYRHFRMKFIRLT